MKLTDSDCQLLSLPAFGERYGLTPNAVRTRLYRGGDLPPSFKVGRNIYFRPVDVERWEQEQVEKETARRAAAAARTGE